MKKGKSKGFSVLLRNKRALRHTVAALALALSPCTRPNVEIPKPQRVCQQRMTVSFRSWSLSHLVPEPLIPPFRQLFCHTAALLHCSTALSELRAESVCSTGYSVASEGCGRTFCSKSTRTSRRLRTGLSKPLLHKGKSFESVQQADYITCHERRLVRIATSSGFWSCDSGLDCRPVLRAVTDVIEHDFKEPGGSYQ